MPKFLIRKAAAERLKEIFHYTQNQWGGEQAHHYINGLFERFEQIANREVIWRSVPAEFEVSGYYTIYERHFIYWKELPSGQIGIVTILHERMHRMDRFKEDAGQ